MGSKSFEPEIVTCDVCGKTAEGYDIYGDFFCAECSAKVIPVYEEEEDGDKC